MQNSHVLPALLRKIHEAKINDDANVIVWGTGAPLREFLHVDDLAEACLFVMANIEASFLYDKGISHINIGSGEELSIYQLAKTLKDKIKYSGKIILIKLSLMAHLESLDCSLINSLGWNAKINLEDGISEVYEIYKKISRSIEKNKKSLLNSKNSDSIKLELLA